MVWAVGKFTMLLMGVEVCYRCWREQGEPLVSATDPVCLKALPTVACLAGVVEISSWGGGPVRERVGEAACKRDARWKPGAADRSNGVAPFGQMYAEAWAHWRPEGRDGRLG